MMKKNQIPKSQTSSSPISHYSPFKGKSEDNAIMTMNKVHYFLSLLMIKG